MALSESNDTNTENVHAISVLKVPTKKGAGHQMNEKRSKWDARKQASDGWVGKGGDRGGGGELRKNQ